MNNWDPNFIIKIKTINVAMSDFVIAVKMWVSTFNVKISFPSTFYAFISGVVGDCVGQSFSKTRTKAVLRLPELLKLGTNAMQM
jgi:hypothetical protein